MGNTRSRAGLMVGLAAAAGAVGVAAMMSAATAPIARADDFSDIVSVVEADFNDGQSAFGNAATDFGSSDISDGLAQLNSGIDDDLLAAPDNLLIGTLDALAGDPVTGNILIEVQPVTDFSDALTFAEEDYTAAQTVFTEAATDLSAGDYADASYLDSLGSINDIATLQVLFEGVIASL
jgi:hypothetical protein